MTIILNLIPSKGNFLIIEADKPQLSFITEKLDIKNPMIITVPFCDLPDQTITHFNTLYALQQKNLIYSPWAKQTPLLQRVKELREEVNEALEEVETQQWEQFKDEIGDVLWDTLGVITKAEHEGHLTITQVLDHIHQKFSERKPFLLEERHVTREEEWKIWKDAKARQKGETNHA